jgi:hypothetical protein
LIAALLAIAGCHDNDYRGPGSRALKGDGGGAMMGRDLSMKGGTYGPCMMDEDCPMGDTCTSPAGGLQKMCRAACAEDFNCPGPAAGVQKCVSKRCAITCADGMCPDGMMCTGGFCGVPE